MTKTQEELIHEQIEQKEKEIDELKDLYFDLKLKRIESEQKQSKGVGPQNSEKIIIPSFKVVEDWDADKIAKIKMEQLGIKTEKIVKEAIQKVILAGIELFIVGDLSDMNAIKEIEGCLKRLKNEEKGKDK